MCDFSRRLFLLGATATVGASLAPAAQAQYYPLMCSYGGDSPAGRGLAPGSPQAVDEVQAILEAIELQMPLAVYRGGVPNASATILFGQPAIVYNPAFLMELFRCNRIAGATVLAHEVGHHANGDTWLYGARKDPWGKELGADWVSGFAMARLGVGLDDALSGLDCAFGQFGPQPSPTHPNGRRRMRAIEDGWNAA